MANLLQHGAFHYSIATFIYRTEPDWDCGIPLWEYASITYGRIRNGQRSNYKNYICAAAGKQANPAPATQAATPNPTTILGYTNTASILYAIMFASSATIGSKVSIFCAHAPEYVMNLNDMRLNGIMVENTLCSSAITRLLYAGITKATIISVSLRLFATAVQGVSYVDG